MKRLQVNRLLQRQKFTTALCVLVTVFVSLNAGAATLVEMSPEELTLLVNEMNASANEVGGKGFFYYEDPFPVTLSVSLDVERNQIVVDMDERIGPRTEQAATEDLLNAISSSVLERDGRVDGVGIRFLFGGKPSTYWFPEPEQDELSDDERMVEPTQVSVEPMVAISPGHGWESGLPYTGGVAPFELLRPLLRFEIRESV
jgi:hypothetical protein